MHLQFHRFQLAATARAVHAVAKVSNLAAGVMLHPPFTAVATLGMGVGDLCRDGDLAVDRALPTHGHEQRGGRMHLDTVWPRPAGNAVLGVRRIRHNARGLGQAPAVYVFRAANAFHFFRE